MRQDDCASQGRYRAAPSDRQGASISRGERVITWSYSPDQAKNVPLYTVRLLIGDTVQCDPQLQDEEIEALLGTRSTLMGAAAECCRSMAAKFSRSIDITAGTMKQSWSQLAKAYSLKAGEFEALAAMGGAGTPYAGAISIIDMQSNSQDPDNPGTQFRVGMHDSYYPVSPVGPEEDIAEAGAPLGPK